MVSSTLGKAIRVCFKAELTLKSPITDIWPKRRICRDDKRKPFQCKDLMVNRRLSVNAVDELALRFHCQHNGLPLDYWARVSPYVVDKLNNRTWIGSGDGHLSRSGRKGESLDLT